MNTMKPETFCYQPRNMYNTTNHIRAFSTLESAVEHGLGNKEPFDVSNRSGAIVWAWELAEVAS